MSADADLIDTPIEISLVGHDTERSHQHVLRPLANGVRYAAVFDRIQAGQYTLWMHNQVRARGVTITGGATSQLDWTTAGEGDPRS